MIEFASQYQASLGALYKGLLNNEILSFQFLNNSVAAYVTAALVFVITYIVLRIVKARIVARLKKLSEKTDTEFDDLITRIVSAFGFPFYVLVSLIVALQFLNVPGVIDKVVSYAVLIVVLYYGVKALQQIIDYGFQTVLKERLEKDGGLDASVVRIFSGVLKGALWVIALLMLLQNLGVNVTALIAGLGIGGLAIAFALQNTIADIFASFSIYFDRPFKTGDYIVVGKDRGSVKYIGIKTTRIQSTQGEEVVIPNRKLTETTVQNYGKIERRRASFTFGVVYETSSEKLRKIPGIVKEIIEKQKLAEFDRTHFKTFGDFSLNFDVVFYFNSSDYAQYLDAQQEINFKLKERFEKEGIEFAYPTQTVFVKK